MECQRIISAASEEREINLGEDRTENRVTILLRSAKLVGCSGEFVCIIRDVSQSGVRLRLFHEVVDDRGMALETTTGDRLNLEKVWERKGEAGFRFVEPIDVKRFLAEAAPFPKRPIRIRLNHPAVMDDGRITEEVTILDISREGAKIETNQHLAIGQTIRLKSDGLPLVDCSVRWRRHPIYGLVFRQLMGIHELASRVHKIQLK